MFAPMLLVARLAVGLSSDTGCDCVDPAAVLTHYFRNSQRSSSTPPGPCVLRGAISDLDAGVAADAAWRYLEAHPTLLRGGNGADVGNFDGGGVSCKNF